MKKYIKKVLIEHFADLLMVLLIIMFAIGIMRLNKNDIGEKKENGNDKKVIITTESYSADIEKATQDIVAQPMTEETTYIYDYATLTGNVSINSVGGAAAIEDLDDAKLGICLWSGDVLTEDELNLLRTTVYCEAGNQDLETQVMVALTILNRLNAGYADSIRGVIYQEGAFAVTKWSNFEGRGWTEQVEQAVEIALSENEHPKDMYYFRTDYYHSFASDYKKSDDLYFSTQKGE